jgi:hypothetical protein
MDPDPHLVFRLDPDPKHKNPRGVKIVIWQQGEKYHFQKGKGENGFQNYKNLRSNRFMN